MRIVSLLPSTTEIVFALGAGDQLVAVTHECDYPAEARTRPAVTASLIPAGLSSSEINAAVVASLRDEHTLYTLDAEQLRALRPDIVLTQNLCEVCAVPQSHVDAAVCTMPEQARVVALDPFTLDEVIDSIEEAGRVLGIEAKGILVAAALRERVVAVEAAVAGQARPRVLAAEWLDPVYCAGHWTPGLVERAGGENLFGAEGENSRAIPWADVMAADPEVILLAPCGFTAAESAERLPEIVANPGWEDLAAVREGRVYAVDATAYYSRPGPRVVDGLELMARLLHPDAFGIEAIEGAARRLQGDEWVGVR